MAAKRARARGSGASATPTWWKRPSADDIGHGVAPHGEVVAAIRRAFVLKDSGALEKVDIGMSAEIVAAVRPSYHLLLLQVPSHGMH